ncbi:hypothetical protein OOK41_01395 [Micromonospora sp. NBC_01655]|uniref:hypothetical protein n=1 Tax=Micromonospora sp. NBC_01655 TaxID=2975983 RepID=UPI0022560363|nr:hypothetical protein [Micromonospora sp. NBC_01655]MCX4468979.1 hypothetical protein [Micromonospora sp. NBC_01655]
MIEIPAGTRLSLRAGEWATHADQLGTTSIDLRVMNVGGEPTGVPGWVRVRGHGLDCRLAPRCLHPWCLELLVQVEALYDAANR